MVSESIKWKNSSLSDRIVGRLLSWDTVPFSRRISGKGKTIESNCFESEWKQIFAFRRLLQFSILETTIYATTTIGRRSSFS